MRSLHSLLVSLLVAAAGLAGCLGGDDGEPSQAQGTTEVMPTTDHDLHNVSVDDGTTEMDAEAGHLPHIHDYWNGRERVTLLDQDVTPTNEDIFRYTFFNTFRGTPGVGGIRIGLPDGAIVYEGTGKLEFTATWSDPKVNGMAMRHRHAGTTEWSQPQPLTTGQAFSVDVTPEMSDMPHAKTSRWEFEIVPGTAGNAIAGPFHVTVEIIKMRDIGLFPGHPELFNGANTLTLFKGVGKSSQDFFALEVARFMLGQNQDDRIVSDKVVPMETLSMTANLTITGFTTTVGDVGEVYFMYKPADSSRMIRANMIESDPAAGVYKFSWPVEMRETDSPYAKESQWKFAVFVTTDMTGTGTLDGCRRCTAAQVDFELEVVAYDSLLDGAVRVDDGRGWG